MRSSRRRFDDSCNPPATGPLAAADWCPSSRRWTVRLNADGWRLVADYLVGRPGDAVRRLKRKWPAVYTAAVAVGLTEDDIAEACEAAVLRAAETFDPARGVPFTGYLSPWLRGSVKVAVERWARHRRYGLRMVSGTADGPNDSAPLFDGIGEDADPRRAAVPMADEKVCRAGIATAVRSVVRAALDATAVLVVSAVFGLDGGGERTVAEVAEAFGWPRPRVHQVLDLSLAELARHLSHLAA